mgnify:CR=1 FL=1
MKFMIPEWNNKTSCLPFSKNFSHITVKKRRKESIETFLLFLLGYSDSNQEKQDQNLLCYHYTIAQENWISPPWGPP